MKNLLKLFVLVSFPFLFAADVIVDPAQAVIVLSPECGMVAKFAAKDLQEHFKLITGKKIPVVSKAVSGKYLFRFVKTAGLKPEEARWKVGKNETVFTGDDENIPAEKNFSLTLKSRTGSISAVADFLERQLKVRWTAPGKDGTFYIPSKVLKLQTASNSWDPGRLVMRGIRPDYVRSSGKKNDRLPRELSLDPKQLEKEYNESILWLKHHRMGGSAAVPFGHSFTRWWKLYGKEHPEYFALVNGKRRPRYSADRVKMCVSNPDLHRKIIEIWKRKNPRPRCINICENDSGGFCECPECRKWDVTPPGEEWSRHLSDRYFRFANEVVKLARSVDREAEVSFYAYAYYVNPPQRVTVDPGVIIGFVPSMLHLQKTETMYKGWRAKGADKLFLRPNDHHVNPGLPIGMEKQLWQGFQLGVKNGIIGTDYDMCHGFWPATGVADYILARAHSYPQASFEELLDHYCEGFGSAAPEIKEYYTYWRQNVWEKRLSPNRRKILERGRYGNFRRGLMWDLPKYFKEADFEITGKILSRAAAKVRTDVEKKSIAALQMAHQHGLLTFQAICSRGSKKVEAGKKLLKFRIVNRDKLNVNLMRQCRLEFEAGDITGIEKAVQFAQFKYTQSLPLKWQFRIDPDGVGEKEKWENSSWKTVAANWQPVYVDSNWENQRRSNVPTALKNKLKNYNGTGWYAQSFKIPAAWKGKKIYLHFGAVDESAKLWVNGKLCGSRIFKTDNDWRTPFALEITEQIDWTKNRQTAVVMVTDKNGSGGIWRPVTLAAK